MARYTGPKCRLCRREGYSLCGKKKCALPRRDQPPGIQRWGGRKPSDYAYQLREKQKVKRIYGLLARQFRRIYDIADRARGNTGQNLLLLLERRLDNVVFRAGFGTTRPFARQMIGHGHVTVNGRKCDIPSYLVKPGDVIKARKEKSVNLFKANFEETKGRSAPAWVESEESATEIKVIGMPSREDVPDPIQEQLIVELLSR